MKDCTYEYSKVDNIRFLGKTSDELLSFSGAAALTKALVGMTDTAPLDMVVHVKATNPNAKVAGLERLYYRVSLDGVEITDGTTEESILIVPGQTVDVPIRMGVDLKALLNSDDRAIVGKAIKTLLHINKEPIEVRVDMKPMIRFGSGVITPKTFIPITFNYPEK